MKHCSLLTLAPGHCQRCSTPLPQYRHRWMQKEWAQSIVDQCRAAGVPVFVKQASGTRPGLHEDLLGEIIQEMPNGSRRMT